MAQKRNTFSEGESVRFRVHGDRTHQDYYGVVDEDNGGQWIYCRSLTGELFKIDQMFVWPK